jgi:hypothetical protein
LFALRFVSAEGATVANVPLEALTQKIPARPKQALTGSQFAQNVAGMDRQQREQAIRDEVLRGNLPAFLRKLAPVEMRWQTTEGKSLTATIFVTPDYLAIGTDQDFLRIPMNLYTAAALAGQLGFVLPTRKMVDAIYHQSRFHFTPQPLPAGPQMTSTEYYLRHNRMIEEQAHATGITLGALVSGDKKDVVISNRLATNPGRIAIYGWQRAEGAPIQPLSTVHGAAYADYSHGIRLVSQIVLMEGKLRSIYELLKDPVLSRVFSDEGPLRGLWSLAPASAEIPANLAALFPTR